MRSSDKKSRLTDSVIYTKDDLPTVGIHWHKLEIRRKVAAGEFPAPFLLGTRTQAWWRQDIVAFLAERSGLTKEQVLERIAEGEREAA